MIGRLWMAGVGAVCLAMVGVVPVTAQQVPVEQGLTASTLSVYTPPTCVPGVPFSDITCTTGFDPWIEQFGLDGITAGCGGGKYCPGTPVTRDQMAVFIEHAMRGTSNWPPHTVLVFHHPAAEAGSDVNSGTELLSMVAAIPSSGAEAPSASNPWLLKVGPGIFDLNGSQLYLPPYVNLDGAGEDITTVTSNNDSSFVLGNWGGICKVSNVTLTNGNYGPNTFVVSFHGASHTLDHVHILAPNGSLYTVGISNESSNLSIYDSNILVGAGTSAYGILTNGGAGYTVAVWRTLFSCNTRDISNDGAQRIDLANSRVPDALSNAVGGVYHCIGNYDLDLAPVTCP